MDAQDFRPKTVRYIKLGRGGNWADEALKNGTIPFGYHAVSHEDCLAERWARVKDQLIASGKTPSGASQGVRQVKDFYTLDDDTLWITIARGHLWWAFSERHVIDLDNKDPLAPSRHRVTKQPWSKLSLTGEPLTALSLSSSLTRTANYRMTVCDVESAGYLLRRIRGNPDPLHARAIVLQEQLRDLASGMIAQLHWQDLESLTDLIFSRDGWRRVGVLGKDQPDVDLIVDHATAGLKAWVQVKTKAKQSELDENLRRFDAQGICDRFYFVCGTSGSTLSIPDEEHLQLWANDTLANAAIDAGLFGWLVDRTR